MKRVLLIGQCKQPEAAAAGLLLLPPMGLHRLGAWIAKTTGAEVKVHDPCRDGMPQPELYEGWDFIGFSPLAETLANDLAQCNVAHLVNPTAEIIVGGVEATTNFQEFFEKAPVTWIVLGYGERALESIVNGLPPNEIGGVIYRRQASHVTGDDLAAFYMNMDFAAIDFLGYWNTTEAVHAKPDRRDIRTIRLVTSTHCNRGCTFCSVTTWYKSAIGRMVAPNMMTAEQIIRLIRKVKCEVPEVETLYLCDDDFCQDRRRVEEFCLKSGDFAVSYLVQAHSSRLDRGLVKTMAAGGIRHISIGIENASPKILKSLRKPQNLDKVPEIISWCKEFGVVPYLFIILFAPESTMDDIRLNICTLRSWLAEGATLSLATSMNVYRGTALHESLHEFSWVNTMISGTKAKTKQADVVLPDDLAVRALMTEFEGRWLQYKRLHLAENVGKGDLAALKLDLVEEIMCEQCRGAGDDEDQRIPTAGYDRTDRREAVPGCGRSVGISGYDAVASRSVLCGSLEEY